jgi:hypothetical protein
MPRLTDTPASKSQFTSVLMPPMTRVYVESKAPKPAARARRAAGGVKLTEAEIRRAVEGQYPPLLTLDLAASISGYARSTLKRQISEGRFKNCVKRKKPVLFWRDRFIQELMQG